MGSILEGVSILLTDAYILELTLIKFYNTSISISISIISSISSVRLSKSILAYSRQIRNIYIIIIHSINVVKSFILLMFAIL